MSGMQSTSARSEGRRTLRWRTLLTSVAITAGAVVLGVSGGGATFAYLNASATLEGATISAGSFGIQINDAATANLGAKVLSPKAPAAWTFKVKNTGAAPAVLSARITAPASPAYAGDALAKIAPVASADACNAGVVGAAAALNGYQAPDLGRLRPTGEQIYCLVVSLPAQMPAEKAGGALSFTVAIDAAQDAS